VSTGGTQFIGKNLDVLAFDRPCVVLTFDQHEKRCTKLSKSNCDVDSILAVWGLDQFLSLDMELRKARAEFVQDFKYDSFELVAIDSGPMVSPGCQ
jgi:hypothetical protein